MSGGVYPLHSLDPAQPQPPPRGQEIEMEQQKIAGYPYPNFHFWSSVRLISLYHSGPEDVGPEATALGIKPGTLMFSDTGFNDQLNGVWSGHESRAYPTSLFVRELKDGEKTVYLAVSLADILCAAVQGRNPSANETLYEFIIGSTDEVSRVCQEENIDEDFVFCLYSTAHGYPPPPIKADS